MGPGIIGIQLMYKYIMGPCNANVDHINFGIGPDNISIYYIYNYYRAHAM